MNLEKISVVDPELKGYIDVRLWLAAVVPIIRRISRKI